MFCSQCGYRLDNDDKFCPRCGARIKTERERRIRQVNIDDVDDYGVEPDYEDDGGPIYEDDSTRVYEDEDDRAPAYEEDDDAADETPKKDKYVMIVCGVVGTIALIAAAALVGYKLYQNQRIGGLKEAYKAYEEAMDEYMVEDDVYRQLLHRAQKAIQDKDLSVAKDIEQELNEAREAIESSSESRRKLTELKMEYMTKLEQFRILGEYEESCNTVMKSLDDAIATSDEKQYDAIKKQLESLVINLKTANEQAVTNIRNEITKLDVSDAKGDDKKLLDDYKVQVDDALAGGNYAAALDTLEQWRTDAERIAKDLKEERESKAESIKAEQERLESESKAKEESSKAESEKETAGSGAYILPQSSSRKLTEADLSGLSANELMLARNEIYARHGRRFVDENLQAYFDSQSWYHGTIEPSAFDSSVLSDVERANISFIGEHE